MTRESMDCSSPRETAAPDLPSPGRPDGGAAGIDWESLLQQARDGDRGAAQQLVELLYPQLFSIIQNHRPRGADPRDLLQEVFMKMFAKLPSYRAEQPFPHWVARIALNTCHDQLRRQRARPELRFSDLSAADLDEMGAVMATDRAIDPGPGRDGIALVQKLLQTLKPHERIVLQLMDLEQKSVREACLLTGWGESKIKVTAMRARRKLNAQLKRLEGEIP
jgi:RNA polymerase sigma-70 factor (ECF subfamily)